MTGNMLLVCLFVCSLCASDRALEEAAREFERLARGADQTEFGDYLVGRIIDEDSLLQAHEEEIRRMIGEFLNSDEYAEARIAAIMHYFSEEEIRALSRELEAGALHRPGRSEQSALLSRYERLFDVLEKKFVEHVRELLRHRELKREPRRRGHRRPSRNSTSDSTAEENAVD